VVGTRKSQKRTAVDEDSAATGDHWGDLMVAAQAGNGGAYRRLLTEIRPWLVRYYARRLPMGMVDDATQDTLIAVHRKRDTYERVRPFKAWLAAIARYKWIDRLRSLGRSATVGFDEEPIEPSVADHGSAVTSAFVLENLMARLKPGQSEAIRLVKLHGFSVEDASAATGQSVSLVKVNIHRGLARMSAMVGTAAKAR
jgi:RNA polymerase sigma factor (sigma-70 family)